MNAAVEQAGAVVIGRRTFEMSDPDAYVGNYEFQVPIFVVTHHPPARTPKQDERLTFTFVSDGIESAISLARIAAGDKLVQVVGARASSNSSWAPGWSTSCIWTSCPSCSEQACDYSTTSTPGAFGLRS
jgi:dihydrofolate reductase